MVREVPDQNGYEAYRSLVLGYGSRDAHGVTTLLIKVMNFNFGHIDVMESKFEEFHLLIKEHVDIAGLDIVPDTIKRAVLVARATESLWTHLQLNSQSYTTFLGMRQAINQYLKARKRFKLKEREDDPNKERRARESPKAKAKEKANTMRKE